MEFFANMSTAFSVALEPMNLLFCFIGCVLGTIVGVLPGLGPPAAISLLIPITYGLNAEAAIIMLAGLYYGCAYGGSITSILLNIPGEASTVVTCLDGYQMAKNGRAGAALGISAFGSFIAGTLATVLIMLMAPMLSRYALKFGPPEFVGLVLMGLTLVTYLSRGPMVKALISAITGILLSLVGTDIMTGRMRFTFGFYQVSEGIELVAIAMGLFGIGEVFQNISEPPPVGTVIKTRLRDLLPTKQDWKDSAGPITRGSFLGFAPRRRYDTFLFPFLCCGKEGR
jgi:putative tricarboxylic transport membrane protein